MDSQGVAGFWFPLITRHWRRSEAVYWMIVSARRDATLLPLSRSVTWLWVSCYWTVSAEMWVRPAALSHCGTEIKTFILVVVWNEGVNCVSHLTCLYISTVWSVSLHNEEPWGAIHEPIHEPSIQSGEGRRGCTKSSSLKLLWPGSEPSRSSSDVRHMFTELCGGPSLRPWKDEWQKCCIHNRVLGFFCFVCSSQHDGGEGVLPPRIFPLRQPDHVPPSAPALQRHRRLWKPGGRGELRWVTVSTKVHMLMCSSHKDLEILQLLCLLRTTCTGTCFYNPGKETDG